MDLPRILTMLRAQLANLNTAILALQRMQVENPGKKRRGRPPKWLAEAKRMEKSKSER